MFLNSAVNFRYMFKFFYKNFPKFRGFVLLKDLGFLGGLLLVLSSIARAHTPFYETDSIELSMDGTLSLGGIQHTPFSPSYFPEKKPWEKKSPTLFFHTPHFLYRHFLPHGELNFFLGDLAPLAHKDTFSSQHLEAFIAYRSWFGSILTLSPQNSLQKEQNSLFEQPSLQQTLRDAQLPFWDMHTAFFKNPLGIRYDTPHIWGVGIRLSYQRPSSRRTSANHLPSEKGISLNWQKNWSILSLKAYLGYEKRKDLTSFSPSRPSTLGRGLGISLFPFGRTSLRLDLLASETSFFSTNALSPSKKQHSSRFLAGITLDSLKIFFQGGRLSPLSFPNAPFGKTSPWQQGTIEKQMTQNLFVQSQCDTP